MNQGGRNSSKIACNGNEEWLDAWRRQVDISVIEWLPNQTAALQQAYQQRADKLGFEQARPFWAAFYTDNFNITFCSSDLAAIGTYIWRMMNGEANINMQPHLSTARATTGSAAVCPQRRLWLHQPQQAGARHREHRALAGRHAFTRAF